ncbi:TPA: hypothetical protein ACXDT3_001966 [Clostridioides difficile]
MINLNKKLTTDVEDSNKEKQFTLEWWEVPPDIRHHLPNIEKPNEREMFVDNGPIPDELNPLSPKYKYKGKEEEVPPNEWFSKN